MYRYTNVRNIRQRTYNIQDFFVENRRSWANTSLNYRFYVPGKQDLKEIFI